MYVFDDHGAGGRQRVSCACSYHILGESLVASTIHPCRREVQFSGRDGLKERKFFFENVVFQGLRVWKMMMEANPECGRWFPASESGVVFERVV